MHLERTVVIASGSIAGAVYPGRVSLEVCLGTLVLRHWVCARGVALPETTRFAEAVSIMSPDLYRIGLGQ